MGDGRLVTRWMSVAAVILVVGGLGSVPASAEDQASTFTVVERAVTDAISVHGGAGADNVGDILTFVNEIYDAADKEKVGSDRGYCVRVVVGKAFECHWTLMLAEGQITVDGPFLDSGDSVLAVTGGTGAYGGARGEMLLHARDAKGSAFDFTYKLK